MRTCKAIAAWYGLKLLHKPIRNEVSDTNSRKLKLTAPLQQTKKDINNAFCLVNCYYSDNCFHAHRL